MSEGGFEEKERERRRALANCSKAILETIRSYGLTAALDVVVRISNYDPIVSEVLPYFPSIARTAMLDIWHLTAASESGQGSAEAPPPEANCSASRQARRTKKK